MATASDGHGSTIHIDAYRSLAADNDWTDAFRAAFTDLAASGGGTLRVSPGTYTTGTITLQSNTTLLLEDGARIVGSTDLKRYRSGAWGHNEDRTPWHLVQAVGCEHVAIAGPGVIDGSGPAFWEVDPDSPDHENGGFIRAYKDRRPSPMVEFSRCRNVVVRDVTLTRSPGWTLHLLDCDDVVVRDIVVINSPWGPNTDGIDLTGVHRCEVSHCRIDTGDDAVCLKTTGDSRDIQDIHVHDCEIRTYCVGLKLGCVESVRDMRRVVFENCTVREASRLIALYSYRGACIEDVTIRGISGDTRAPLIQNRPIHIESRLDTPDASQPDGFVHDPVQRPPRIRRVHLDNIFVETDGRIMLVASEGTVIEDIALKNIRLEYPYVYYAPLTAAEAASRQFAVDAIAARGAQASIVVDGAVAVDLTDIYIQWPEVSFPEAVPESWRFGRKFENGSFRSFPVTAREIAENAHVLWVRGPARVHLHNTPKNAYGRATALDVDNVATVIGDVE